MNLDDLDLRELLSFNPQGGVLRFAGERAVLADVVSMGLLRRDLIETLGMSAARALLWRLGYATGWRTAESTQKTLPWDDERTWQLAGARLHMLRGEVRVEFIPQSDDGPNAPFAESMWHDSYEAEQHLLHLGQSDVPVCWGLCGYVSGYLSFVNGREISVTENRCVGKGDPVCHVIGRPPEEWSAEDAPLTYADRPCLEGHLAQLTEQIKTAERRLKVRRRALRGDGAADEDAEGLVARSTAMRRLLELARRGARTDATVLITGESGAGKERIAQLIHESSTRSGRPFVAINCAALTESLLESELFGHARGAFTGATSDRPGLFEAAHGGTLFLDEIGEIPLTMQSKLLRVLQEREIRRVGENHSRKVDVRLVAATNRELLEEVNAGSFRQDLYYRLRVIELRVPPLRERREDVLPLARLLLAEASSRLGRRVDTLSPEAADHLQRYGWPGNVRELANALERAVALCEGHRVELDDLPEEVRRALPVARIGGERTLEEVEREHILAVLTAADGNRARAAKTLGIGEATLYRRLRSWGEGNP